MSKSEKKNWLLESMGAPKHSFYSYTKDCGNCKVVVGYIFVNHFVIKTAYRMRTPTDEERLMSV